ETLTEEDAQLVPVRRYRGPVSLRPHLRKLMTDEREVAQAMLKRHSAFTALPADVALYWADGVRTLAAILDLIELETGVRDADGLAAYFKLLARLELIELRCRRSLGPAFSSCTSPSINPAARRRNKPCQLRSFRTAFLTEKHHGPPRLAAHQPRRDRRAPGMAEASARGH